MDTHRIELGSVIKHRNKSEYRPVSVARMGEYVEIGDGPLIKRLCQQMMADGIVGMVEVWRDDTIVFHATDISVWASGKHGKGKQPEHLVNYNET